MITRTSRNAKGANLGGEDWDEVELHEQCRCSRENNIMAVVLCYCWPANKVARKEGKLGDVRKEARRAKSLRLFENGTLFLQLMVD